MASALTNVVLDITDVHRLFFFLLSHYLACIIGVGRGMKMMNLMLIEVNMGGIWRIAG